MYFIYFWNKLQLSAKVLFSHEHFNELFVSCIFRISLLKSAMIPMNVTLNTKCRGLSQDVRGLFVGRPRYFPRIPRTSVRGIFLGCPRSIPRMSEVFSQDVRPRCFPRIPRFFPRCLETLEIPWKNHGPNTPRFFPSSISQESQEIVQPGYTPPKFICLMGV